MATRRILILGGGFGGVYTTLELERRLRQRDDVEVLLVSRENFFTFTPMLHEVAASDLEVTHSVNPIRKLLRRAHFLLAEVQWIDLERRQVRVSHLPDRHEHVLDYDHLVLALGSTTNFHGLPGAEHALAMKSLGDAIHLRNRVIQQLEDADTECAARAAQRDSLTACVVAGGGFAGVETLAAVNDFVRESLRFYPHLDVSRLRMVLVHSGEGILPELDPRLGRYAERKLAERGVELRLGRRVRAFTGEEVLLDDATRIPSRILVWTAGTAPSPLIEPLPCKKEAGRVLVRDTLELPEWPGVWALGDCAWIPDPRTGRSHPPTAQHALREARTLACNLVARLRGRPEGPFVFNTLGQLAAIGRRSGVASLFGLRFSGGVAWFLWRTIYWAKLPRLEKKLRVAIDWTLDLLFSKDLVQLGVQRSEEKGPRVAAQPGGPAGIQAP
jgi:NADH dehydrogenase